MGNFKDLTGMKFGRWTVIKRGEDYISPNGRHKTRWLCLCDCQLNLPEEEREYHLVTAYDLKHGTSKSCGCLNREITSKTLKKYNKYDLDSKEYGIGYTNNTDKYGRNEFWFDKEDYNLIKDYCWYFDGKNYVTARDGNRKIKLHRLIMRTLNCPTEIEVDHIKQNRYDNRKSQLRIATNSQNQFNKGLRKNNTTGVTGIYEDKNHTWRVYICTNYENLYLGRFKTKEEAIKARKEAEEKYFGEWSYDNSQKHDINEN